MVYKDFGKSILTQCIGLKRFPKFKLGVLMPI